MSTKSCYLYLLSENVVQPHCVVKFASDLVTFIDLTQGVLSIFSILIARLLISVGKSPIVFFRVRCAFFPLGCQFLCIVFVDLLWSLYNICSFLAHWLKMSCLGFSLLCLVSLQCALLFSVVTFFLVLTVMSCVLCLAFLSIF